MTHTPEAKIVKRPVRLQAKQSHSARVTVKADILHPSIAGETFQHAHPTLAQLKTTTGIYHRRGALQTRGVTISAP